MIIKHNRMIMIKVLIFIKINSNNKLINKKKYFLKKFDKNQI